MDNYPEKRLVNENGFMSYVYQSTFNFNAHRAVGEIDWTLLRDNVRKVHGDTNSIENLDRLINNTWSIVEKSYEHDWWAVFTNKEDYDLIRLMYL